MADIPLDRDLYRTSASYRELYDHLFRLDTELVALKAAYTNAMADQRQVSQHVADALDKVTEAIRASNRCVDKSDCGA